MVPEIPLQLDKKTTLTLLELRRITMEAASILHHDHALKDLNSLMAEIDSMLPLSKLRDRLLALRAYWWSIKGLLRRDGSTQKLFAQLTVILTLTLAYVAKFIVSIN